MSQPTRAGSENREPTTAEKIGKLHWSIGANAANTVFVQFTFFGSAFVLLLSELGFSKLQIGLLLSFFPYTGLIALFIAPAVARHGAKRTFLTFFAARKIMTTLLLLTPLVLALYGFRVTLTFVFVVTLLFALCRSIAETGYYPWHQEYVPSAVRGKYSATNNIFGTLTGFIAVAVASFIIDRSVGLSGYMLLIGIGVLFGFVSVWCYSHTPGGAPIPNNANGSTGRDLGAALRDGDFWRYLVGAGLITLAITPLVSFLPLFMQEQVGISAGNVVLIQTGTLLGGLLSTYWWGWAADRYGSKPIMLLGASFQIALPLCWMLMPRYSDLSLYAALFIALFQGIANMGWLIGSARLLHVSIVPSDKKTDYMALYYAWIGAVGGSSQLIGGQLLQFTADLSGRFFIFTLDPFIGLFSLGLLLPLVSIMLLRTVRADTSVSMEEFAFMFLRGNPFRAMSSLVEYYMARDEHATVLVTERLGQAKSPLAVDELLEALKDPRFNVRFEATISIARMRPDPRLTAALVQVLHGSELALSVNAAWALGRIGDQTAVATLRDGLHSNYRSIRAHCAHALGTLGDVKIVPLLLQRLETETDMGLQMAYASALGNLGYRETAPALLRLLAQTRNEGARMELALSLARLLGDERAFIQLWRQSRIDVATTTSQAVTALKKKISKETNGGDDLTALVERCADLLARHELREGGELLAQLAAGLPASTLDETAASILHVAVEQYVRENGRIEYLLLTLHALTVGWQ